MNRNTPLSIKSRIIKNRVVIPPMASETASETGLVTERTIEHYSNLNKAHVGLLMVEYSFVHASGRSEQNQLGINDDSQIPGLTQIAKIIKSSGAVAGIQITHSGGKTESHFTDGILHSPSGIVVPVKDKVLETPQVMTDDDIQNWKLWFLEAAGRAVRAGFDLIELHAAHGYGLNQWLSPITNKTNYRLGFLLDIASAIRSAYPHLLISVRMPGQDFIEGGLTISDSKKIAKSLEAIGVDIINVSSGIGGWKRPRERNGEGYLVEEAALIQRHVSVPVIGVGGIESGAYIDKLISENTISLAAVGRAILKDPQQWKEVNL
jgi:NADPH2 dehydrogenase